MRERWVGVILFDGSEIQVRHQLTWICFNGVMSFLRILHPRHPVIPSYLLRFGVWMVGFWGSK